MANEILGKKEDLYEVDWVKEQTKSALSSLQKEVLYTKNGDEVKFDVDTSLNHLKTLKDKKSYREVMAQNAGTTVMAVQILLKNKGYNIGKVDGILRSKGQATSNTMEAIKKFQRDNGLTDDGAPGPDTIKKILAVYENGGGNGGGGTEVVEDEEKVKDLTEAEYETLCKKISLTDDEIKQVVEYANKNDEMIIFTGLTSITDKQAEELGKTNGMLSIKGLTSITDKQAEFLSKVKGRLLLNGLKSITDKQAEELGKLKVLDLDGVTSITDKQAEFLGKVESLSLSGLTSITDKQAENLSKIKRSLRLDGVTSMTDKQAVELAKVEDLRINKSILTPKQKQILGK